MKHFNTFEFLEQKINKVDPNKINFCKRFQRPHSISTSNWFRNNGYMNIRTLEDITTIPTPIRTLTPSMKRTNTTVIKT